MTDPEQHIGLRVRMVRERRGLSRRRLEVLAGLSRGYVSRLEAGERLNIGNDTISALVKVLAVPIGWLATGEGEMDESSRQTTYDHENAELRAAVEWLRGRLDDAYLDQFAASHAKVGPEGPKSREQYRADIELGYAAWRKRAQPAIPQREMPEDDTFDVTGEEPPAAKPKRKPAKRRG